MEIAVIGSGISGLSASLFLSKKNNVTLYEKNDYLGGHTNTKTIHYKDKRINVDTGFIVFNKLYYPNLMSYLEQVYVSTYYWTYRTKETNCSISLKLNT